MTTPRVHAFEVGRKYRVLKDIRTQTSSFCSGEVVEFKDAAYGRYEKCTAFRFASFAGGECNSWFLYDQDIDNSKELFAPVG